MELLWPSRDRIEVVAHSGENPPGVYYIVTSCDLSCSRLFRCSFGVSRPWFKELGSSFGCKERKFSSIPNMTLTLYAVAAKHRLATGTISFFV